MKKKIIIPPIKSQGIKTKLVEWIADTVMKAVPVDASWTEPFFGTGVVGLNMPLTGMKFVADVNFHNINFYRELQSGNITAESLREYLKAEGALLSRDGYSHYLKVRDRFNESYSPYDYIFLSRSGFNGLCRFNSSGKWNVPFCKKPDRFAAAYVTKICNQADAVRKAIADGEWKFMCQDFRQTIDAAPSDGIIYCDPPYYGRNTGYFNTVWTEDDEKDLRDSLVNNGSKFIVSTWSHNDFRRNLMLDMVWNGYNILTREHEYFAGGHVENRHTIVEALICNF